MPRPKLTEGSAPVVVRNLSKWLRECLYLVKDGDTSRFSRVLARHLVKGNKQGEEVFYIDVPKKAKDEWTETAAIDIYNRLQAEASTLGGLQKYALYAYHTDDNEHHSARFVIRIQGTDEDDDEDGLNSEGPDKTGLTSQAMRHAEVLMKVNTGSQMTAISALQTLVNRQSQMIEKLMETRLQSIDVIEELITKKHEREIELMQADTKARAVRDVAGKLGLFIPALANKIAGQQLFPVQANAVMMMVKGLVTSIAADEDKMKQLVGLLNPEQTVAFMNVLEEVSKNVGDNGLPTDGNSVNGAATHTTEGNGQ